MNKNLKIAIIGSRGYPHVYSGYETLVKELSERLVKKGHKVSVYCHSSLFIKKPKQVNGIELIYTPSIQTKTLSQITNSFFSFIHVCFTKIDVVLVVNSANGPFGILTKMFGIKTCINVDGLEWLRPKWKGFGAYYFKAASKLATIFFDEIITDSVEMKKVYLTKYRTNSTVIAYGSTMSKSGKMNILKQFNLKKRDYYLVVGRLIPDNNSELIINGFLRSNSNKKIVIVGDVPYADEYADRVKELASEKIVFTGYIKCQKKLSELYLNCFSYLHGHEFGGTNPTMINALKINCQVLALSTIFNNEMLKNKKVIFFNKNINSITKAIVNNEKHCNTFKKSNQKYKLPKIYRWSYICNQYLDVFNRLIKK